MKTSGDHRQRQREKAPDMAANDHFGSWVREVLPHWAEPLWATPLKAGKRRGGGSRIQGERGRGKGQRRRTEK